MDQWLDRQGGGFLIRDIGVRIPADPPILGLDCVCTPIGRGTALRAHSVAVRLGPDAPVCFSIDRRIVDLAENCFAPLRIWRGDPAVDRARGIRFPYGAPAGCSSVRPRVPVSDTGGRWFKSNHPDQFTLMSGDTKHSPRRRAPIAQLAERTAYTRRELRTGARLEVRLLLGVPAIRNQGPGVSSTWFLTPDD